VYCMNNRRLIKSGTMVLAPEDLKGISASVLGPFDRASGDATLICALLARHAIYLTR